MPFYSADPTTRAPYFAHAHLGGGLGKRRSLLDWIAGFFAALFGWVRNRFDEERAAHELEGMDDSMLSDIGISRSNIRSAVKGRWT